MRATVCAGLSHLLDCQKPLDTDGFLLALGDQPGINAELVDRLVDAYQARPGRILVPTCRGKRGHPVLFPWTVWPELKSLPADCGLNELLRRDPQQVVELTTDDETILEDLDDPADYARHQRRRWS